MNEIEKFNVVKKDKLKQNDYFNSLIKEAYKYKLLSDEDMQNVQISLIEILDKTVYRYNKMESSSIRKEIANEIMESNIYILGLYLKKFNNPDEAIDLIKKNDILEIYNNSKKHLKNKIKMTKFIYYKVLQNMIRTKNETYILTLTKGITGFFKIYNYEYNAQNIKITADYPTYKNIIGKFEGIEFIEKYLKSIYYENEFCNIFDIKDIERLLYSYSKDYKELIINIFEIVLLQAIGCRLARKELHNLNINNSDLTQIYNIFDDASEKERSNIIENAYNKIKEELLEEKEEIINYIDNNFNEIRFTIICSLKNKTLDKVFIVNKLLN